MVTKRSFLQHSVALFLVLLFTGCASTPKVDWNKRVGAFTYDQAVIEMGPPNRSSKLTDGSTVAEWLQQLRPRAGMTFGARTGFTTGGVGIGVGQTVSPAQKGQYLRLTFDQAGKLTNWENVVR